MDWKPNDSVDIGTSQTSSLNGKIQMGGGRGRKYKFQDTIRNKTFPLCAPPTPFPNETSVVAFLYLLLSAIC